MFVLSVFSFLYVLLVKIYCGIIVFRWCLVLWHVRSYFSHKSPVSRDPAAQTTDGDIIVRPPVFPSSAILRIGVATPGAHIIALIAFVDYPSYLTQFLVT
jgi:hypothetical protein